MLEELLLLIQIPLKFQTEFLSSHVFNHPSIPRLFFLAAFLSFAGGGSVR